MSTDEDIPHFRGTPTVRMKCVSEARMAELLAAESARAALEAFIQRIADTEVPLGQGDLACAAMRKKARALLARPAGDVGA